MLSAFSSIGRGVRAFSSGVSSAVSQFATSVFPKNLPSDHFIAGQPSAAQTFATSKRSSV